MTTIRRGALLPATIAAMVVLGGCGGGDDGAGTTSTVAEPVPPAIAAKANANCRAMVREARKLATGVILRYQHSFESLTAIVEQGMPVLERIANRQKALAPEAHSPAYDLYAGLFDPIIVLLQERLQAGKAQERTRSKRLDGLIAGLNVEQKDAARKAGLTGCDVDFRATVTQAAFGASGL